MSGSPAPARKVWKHRQRMQEESALSGAAAPSTSSASDFLDGASKTQNALAAPAFLEQQRASPRLELRAEQLEEQLSRRLQDVESQLGRLDDVERRLSELEAKRPAQPALEEKPEVVEDTTFSKLKREGEELREEAIEEAAGDPLAVEEVSLEGTVWDCVLLITLRGPHGLLLSPVQICCVLLLSLLNVMLQAVCILGIKNYMIQDPLTEDIRNALLSQRLIQNHQLNNLDSRNLLTKASLLCDQEVYNSAGLLYEDVSNYLAEYFFGFRAGEFISLIAMLFWTLTMTQEMQRIFQLAKTVSNLRKFSDDSPRENVVINEGSNGYNIVRMTTTRKFAFLILVLLPRAVVGFLLLFYGLRWLADTIAVSDLILNACALEIVKGVDEALFAAVLVGVVKVECFKFEPMTVAPQGTASKRIKQCIMFLAPCAFITGMLGWGHADTLAGFVENVQTANNFLCEEDLNFVWATHSVVALPFFAPVSGGETSPSSGSGSSTTEQLKCLFAASDEMIKIRAGFDSTWVQVTDTLRAQMQGTDASCSVNVSGRPQQSPCPSVELSGLYEVQGMTPQMFLSPDFGRCRDLFVHMQVLHDVCTHPEFAGDYTTIFDGRAKCRDMVPLCQCRGWRNETGECAMDVAMYEEVAQTYNISARWIRLIQMICPDSCDMCLRTPQPPSIPGDGPGASTTAADSETQSGPDSVDEATTTADESDSQTT